MQFFTNAVPSVSRAGSSDTFRSPGLGSKPEKPTGIWTDILRLPKYVHDPRLLTTKLSGSARRANARLGGLVGFVQPVRVLAPKPGDESFNLIHVRVTRRPGSLDRTRCPYRRTIVSIEAPSEDVAHDPTIGLAKSTAYRAFSVWRKR